MLKTEAGAIVSGGREPDRIIRRHQLKDLTGYTPGHVYALIQKGEFPRPIKLGAQASGWLAREIEAWQQERIARRDAGKAS